MDLNDIMKNAADIKKKMEDFKKEMSSWRITGEVGGGMVKVIMDGTGKVVKLEMSDELLKEERELQEALIQSAINLTSTKVKQEVADKQKQLMGIPGNIDIPF